MEVVRHCRADSGILRHTELFRALPDRLVTPGQFMTRRDPEQPLKLPLKQRIECRVGKNYMGVSPMRLWVDHAATLVSVRSLCLELYV